MFLSGVFKTRMLGNTCVPEQGLEGGKNCHSFVFNIVLRVTEMLGKTCVAEQDFKDSMLGNTCVLERGFQDANVGQ